MDFTGRETQSLAEERKKHIVTETNEVCGSVERCSGSCPRPVALDRAASIWQTWSSLEDSQGVAVQLGSWVDTNKTVGKLG